MNGAQSLIRTLVGAGVDVCFTNPGTSEMHFVTALDDVLQMRGVLGLFEGVVTGAADGYARMAGRPAGALLHLGPGLGNGLANLHNARKGNVPVVAIIGDHATYHRGLGAPLESDIETVARNVSVWVRTSAAPERVGADAAEAVAAAIGAPGQVATLILPADVSWSDGGRVAAAVPPVGRMPVSGDVIDAATAAARSGGSTLLLLGGPLLADPGALDAARRICVVTGARMLAETFPTRLSRGAGVAPVERLGYFAEQATAQLDGVEHLLLVGAAPPVTFFAHPGRPNELAPEGCRVHPVAGPADDGAAALDALATALSADAATAAAQPAARRPPRPAGALDAAAIARAVGALLPEGAIVSDEAITSGAPLPAATAGAPRHDWLTLTGGAIGQGLPVATGAAVACPDRKVVALQADGSAMYTLQALWTQAREGLDVTTIIYNNASYEILKVELDRVGATGAGERALDLYDIGRPRLDFVALARGMGVPGTRAETAEQLTEQLERALAEPGPAVIDAVVPQLD